jgi:hypothetical protein
MWQADSGAKEAEMANGWRRRNTWTTTLVVSALLVAFLVWGLSYYGGGLATDEVAPTAEEAPETTPPDPAVAADVEEPAATSPEVAD